MIHVKIKIALCGLILGLSSSLSISSDALAQPVELKINTNPKTFPRALPSLITPQILEGIRSTKSEFDIALLKKSFQGTERMVILVAHHGGYENLTMLNSLARNRRIDIEAEIAEDQGQLITEEDTTVTPTWRALGKLKFVYDQLDSLNTQVRLFFSMPFVSAVPDKIEKRIGFKIFDDFTLYWAIERAKTGSAAFVLPKVQVVMHAMRAAAYAYGVYSVVGDYVDPYAGNKGWFKSIFILNGMENHRMTNEIVARIDNALANGVKSNLIVVPISYVYYEETARRLVEQKDFERVTLPDFLEY